MVTDREPHRSRYSPAARLGTFSPSQSSGYIPRRLNAWKLESGQSATRSHPSVFCRVPMAIIPVTIEAHACHPRDSNARTTLRPLRTGSAAGIMRLHRPAGSLWSKCATGNSDAGCTKVRNLLALGTCKRQAILTAISSRSYWHLSKTLATQTGMTNDWLKSQGLISVRALWMRAHGYT